MLLVGKTRYPRRMLVFHPVTWNLLLVAVPDIAQAMQVPTATWMSVMSQSSTNTAIVIWCIAAAVMREITLNKKGVLNMKPDYKNWIPKGMLVSLIAGTVLSLALLLVFGVFGVCVSGKLRVVLGVVFGIAFVVCAKYTQWCVYAYRSFSYDGERKLSKQIIDGTAEHITLPEDGVGLDIGCGSGALTIACAKRNPQGKMIGIDRWGKEYASFTLPLCEKNAAAEGVKNALFRRGNAVKLDFPDESFDAVTSNYVYHNITGKDKQQLLLETLRVLKKGGTFAIHDLMSPGRYGDMQAFVQKLRDMGYERVELIDTTDGSFMTPKEAKRLMLRGSTLLVGRK